MEKEFEVILNNGKKITVIGDSIREKIIGFLTVEIGRELKAMISKNEVMHITVKE